MAAAQALKQLTWDADTIAAMMPCVQFSPWPGIAGLKDALGGSHLWEFTDGRARVMLAVHGLVCEGGRVLEVTGMRSLGERVPAGVLGPVMDRLALQTYDADMLSMVTRRPHLVRGCERAGWANVASVVTKKLKVH